MPGRNEKTEGFRVPGGTRKEASLTTKNEKAVKVFECVLT
jgi:hypothetical protein